MKTIGMMLSAVAAFFAYGYGDLPAVFDASTGYVTMNSSDGTGAGNQSFFLAKNWSDGRPPHSDTDYYVQAGRCLGTPHVDSDVTAQQATDPTGYLTFQGRTLVVAGYLWHLNGTYDFTFPDLRMLPNTYISYTAIKTPLSGTMTVYGTEAQPTCLRSNLGDIYQQPFGMDIKGDSSSCLAIYNSDKPTWYKLQGNLSDFHGVLSAGHPSNAEATGSYGFHVTSDHVAGTVALPRKKASLCVTSANGLSVGGLRVTEKETRLFLDGSQLSSTTPRLTVTNSLEVTGWAYVMLHTPTQGSGNRLVFNDYVVPAEADDKILIRLEPEVVRKGGWNGKLDELFRLPSDANMASSSLRWRDDVDGGKSLVLVTCVAHTTVGETNSRGSLAFPTLTDGGTDYFWSNESYPTDDPASGYSSSKTIYTPSGSGLYEFPGRLLLLTSAQIFVFGSQYGFVCDDFEWRAGGVNASINAGDPAGPVRKDENGTACNCYNVRGTIRVPAGFVNTLQSYGARTVIRLESELTGGGDMTVQTINYAGDYKNDKGFVEFAACNTNFTGKVKVSTADNTTKYANLGIVVPNWEQHMRLFVSDERNLGGVRDEFAWDALLIEQYSDLWPHRQHRADARDERADARDLASAQRERQPREGGRRNARARRLADVRRRVAERDADGRREPAHRDGRLHQAARDERLRRPCDHVHKQRRAEGGRHVCGRRSPEVRPRQHEGDDGAGLPRTQPGDAVRDGGLRRGDGTARRAVDGGPRDAGYDEGGSVEAADGAVQSCTVQELARNAGHRRQRRRHLYHCGEL